MEKSDIVAKFDYLIERIRKMEKQLDDSNQLLYGGSNAPDKYKKKLRKYKGVLRGMRKTIKYFRALANYYYKLNMVNSVYLNNMMGRVNGLRYKVHGMNSRMNQVNSELAHSKDKIALINESMEMLEKFAKNPEVIDMKVVGQIRDKQLVLDSMMNNQRGGEYKSQDDVERLISDLNDDVNNSARDVKFINDKVKFLRNRMKTFVEKNKNIVKIRTHLEWVMNKLENCTGSECDQVEHDFGDLYKVVKKLKDDMQSTQVNEENVKYIRELNQYIELLEKHINNTAKLQTRGDSGSAGAGEGEGGEGAGEGEGDGAGAVAPQIGGGFGQLNDKYEKYFDNKMITKELSHFNVTISTSDLRSGDDADSKSDDVIDDDFYDKRTENQGKIVNCYTKLIQLDKLFDKFTSFNSFYENMKSANILNDVWSNTFKKKNTDWYDIVLAFEEKFEYSETKQDVTIDVSNVEDLDEKVDNSYIYYINLSYVIFNYIAMMAAIAGSTNTKQLLEKSKELGNTLPKSLDPDSDIYLEEFNNLYSQSGGGDLLQQLQNMIDLSKSIISESAENIKKNKKYYKQYVLASKDVVNVNTLKPKMIEGYIERLKKSRNEMKKVYIKIASSLDDPLTYGTILSYSHKKEEKITELEQILVQIKKYEENPIDVEEIRNLVAKPSDYKTDAQKKAEKQVAEAKEKAAKATEEAAAAKAKTEEVTQAARDKEEKDTKISKLKTETKNLYKLYKNRLNMAQWLKTGDKGNDRFDKINENIEAYSDNLEGYNTSGKSGDKLNFVYKNVLGWPKIFQDGKVYWITTLGRGHNFINPTVSQYNNNRTDNWTGNQGFKYLNDKIDNNNLIKYQDELIALHESNTLPSDTIAEAWNGIKYIDNKNKVIYKLATDVGATGVQAGGAKPRLDSYKKKLNESYKSLIGFIIVFSDLMSIVSKKVDVDKLDTLASIVSKLSSKLRIGKKAYIDVYPLMIFTTEFPPRRYNSEPEYYRFTFEPEEDAIYRTLYKNGDKTEVTKQYVSTTAAFLESNNKNTTEQIVKDDFLGISNIIRLPSSAPDIINRTIGNVNTLGASGTGKTSRLMGNPSFDNEADRKGIVSSVVESAIRKKYKVSISYFIVYGQGIVSGSNVNLNESLIFIKPDLTTSATGRTKTVYHMKSSSVTGVDKYSDFYVNLVTQKLHKIAFAGNVDKWLQGDKETFTESTSTDRGESFREVIENNDDLWVDLAQENVDSLHVLFEALIQEQKKIFTIMPTRNNIESSRGHTCFLIRFQKTKKSNPTGEKYYFPVFDMAGTENVEQIEKFFNRVNKPDNLKKLLGTMAEIGVSKYTNKNNIKVNSLMDMFEDPNDDSIRNFVDYRIPAQGGGAAKTLESLKNDATGFSGMEPNNITKKVIGEGRYINHTIAMYIFSLLCVSETIKADSDGSTDGFDTINPFQLMKDSGICKFKVDTGDTTGTGPCTDTRYLVDLDKELASYNGILSKSCIWLQVLFSFMYWNKSLKQIKEVQGKFKEYFKKTKTKNLDDQFNLLTNNDNVKKIMEILEEDKYDKKKAIYELKEKLKGKYKVTKEGKIFKLAFKIGTTDFEARFDKKGKFLKTMRKRINKVFKSIKDTDDNYNEVKSLTDYLNNKMNDDMMNFINNYGNLNIKKFHDQGLLGKLKAPIDIKKQAKEQIERIRTAEGDITAAKTIQLHTITGQMSKELMVENTLDLTTKLYAATKLDFSDDEPAGSGYGEGEGA